MSAIYSPLDPTHHETRIFILRLGKWDDEIHGTLRKVSLDEQPEYTALSYVWGDAKDTVKYGFLVALILDGHVFPVRVNLGRALRRLRYESQEPRALWIDSVSINQSDLAERSHQVRIMGQIYKSTKQCIMWLGETDEEPIQRFHRPEIPDALEMRIFKGMIQDLKLTTPKALRHAGKETEPLDVLGAYEVVELLTQNKHFYEMPFFRLSPTGEIELSEKWAKSVYALENILRRRWWQRIWTIQEAFLPKQANIQVGPYTISYLKFVKAARAWEAHVWGPASICCSSIAGLWVGHDSIDLRPIIDRIVELSVLQEARTSLEKRSVAHNIFHLSIQRSATLRHDHVYGLFGLITEFFQLDEQPDYLMDLAQLYAATTIKFMANAKHLCLLPYARPHLREVMVSEKDGLQDLPSWTPDWSTYAWGDYFDIYNFGGFTADKTMEYNGAHHRNAILKLEGVVLDRIAKIGGLIGNMNVPPADFVPTVQTWVDMAREKGLSPRALWEVMHVATHKDIGLSMVDRQAEWWERLKKFAGEGTTLQEMRDAAKGTLHLSCLACMEFLDKRAFYTTEPVPHADKTHNDDPDAVSDYCAKFPSGSLGVALLSVREGDVICVVKGGRTPFILRPLLDPALQAKAGAEGITEDELSNCYTLVSMCYIYGMMQGQTVAEKPAWETIYLL